jgi:hypothetical protein
MQGMAYNAFRAYSARDLSTTANLGRWPRAGSPAEQLGWGARLLHCAPLALRPEIPLQP